MKVTVIASIRFRDGRHSNVSGLTAQLWDQDSFSDDTLAKAVATGCYPDFTAEFVLDLSKASSLDSPFETRPDLYVLIEDLQGQEVFRSKVHKDVSFSEHAAPGQSPGEKLQLIFTQE